MIAAKIRSRTFSRLKVAGNSVYDGQNRNIGKVKDLVLDRDGRIAVVVVDVGSFLGVGGKYVGINIGDIKTNANPTEPAWAGLVREKARARMRRQLSPARSCACRRPHFGRGCARSLSGLDPLRDRITVLCAHGRLTGVPQVTILGTSVDGLPVGLTILGARGKDAALVAVTRMLASV